MRLIKPNTSIDFVSYGKYAVIFSALLVLVTFVSFSMEKLTFGVDFTGGVVVEVGYPDAVPLEDVRGALADGGYPDATVQHTDEQRGGKAVDDLAAEKEQRQQRKDRGARGHQRTRQRLVDRRVDHFGRRGLAHAPEILANTVVDHDRVVERVADHRQQCGEHGQIEVEVKQREHAERDRDVVHQRGHRAGSELPVEAHDDVDQDRDHRVEQGQTALVDEFVTHLRADEFDATQVRGIRALGRLLTAGPKLAKRRLRLRVVVTYIVTRVVARVPYAGGVLRAADVRRWVALQSV